MATERFLDPNIARKNTMQEAHIDDAPLLPGGQPIFSHIEFSICGLCNRTCVFCPRADPETYPNRTEYLSLELYEKILGELAAVDYRGRLSYSGFSEPFYHKKLVEMVEMTKAHLPNGCLEMVTNGDMLTPDNLARLYAAGLDGLMISMYDGPEQIDTLRAMAGAAGVPEDWLMLRNRYLSAEEGFGINMSNRAGTVTGLQDIGVAATIEPLKRPCHYTHYRMMVDHTGEVLLCPHDWSKSLIVGDLNRQNIIDVWTGPALSAARRRLADADRNFAPCNVCDVEGTLQGKAHFDLWQAHRRT